MNTLAVDRLVSFGSVEYLLCLALVLFGRGMDLLSTWIATPTLELEANPIAKRLGWRLGFWVNVALSVAAAFWPLPAISIATTSVLVAARNLQSAWLMRTLGEHEYRVWIAARFRETQRGVFVICLVMQTALLLLVGAGLMATSRLAIVPFAVGLGIVTYAVAVAFFTSLAMRRAARGASLHELS
jgi:hypothetical protein